MAGEISPDIMFSGKNQKNVRGTFDVCLWVHMGAMECKDVEGHENTVKRGRYVRGGRVLQWATTAKKPRESG